MTTKTILLILKTAESLLMFGGMTCVAAKYGRLSSKRMSVVVRLENRIPKSSKAGGNDAWQKRVA